MSDNDNMSLECERIQHLRQTPDLMYIRLLFISTDEVAV